jgi:hypothetical protein
MDSTPHPRHAALKPRLQDVLSRYGGGRCSEWSLEPWKLFDQERKTGWVLECPWTRQHPTVERLFLSSDTLHNWRLFSHQILEQLQLALGPDFQQVWIGTKAETGLLVLLTRRIQHERLLNSLIVEPSPVGSC